MEESFDDLIWRVRQWAESRDLLNATSAPKQSMKLMEELGETMGAILRGKEEKIKDGIGDILVTTIILSLQLGLEPRACLNYSLNEIWGRKGKTIDGTFIKDEQ